MNISFYKPSDEIIPIMLRLKVNDIQVHYRQIDYPEYIAYEFIVWQENIDESAKIMNEIMKLMERQSEDYGQSWRREALVLEGHTTMYNRYTVKFKVRDAG